MIKVTFLYPNKPGSRFNAEYYIDVHMPLAIRLLGSALKGVSAEIGLSSAMPDSPPPNAAIASFTFESVEAFSAAVMPHYKELQSDIPNYTDIEPIVQISDLRIAQ
ncbi:MAG: EthD family reductase [Terracidiphilus sp.]